MTLAMIDAFPQFRDRDLYFTGESYAGLYIPMVADRLLNNTAESKAHGVNFKGPFKRMLVRLGVLHAPGLVQTNASSLGRVARTWLGPNEEEFAWACCTHLAWFK